MEDKLSRDFRFSAHFYRALAVFLAERLRKTTSILGYGDARRHQNNSHEQDEPTDDLMDSTSLAVVRFDGLFKKLQGA